MAGEPGTGAGAAPGTSATVPTASVVAAPGVGAGASELSGSAAEPGARVSEPHASKGAGGAPKSVIRRRELQLGGRQPLEPVPVDLVEHDAALFALDGALSEAVDKLLRDAQLCQRVVHVHVPGLHRLFGFLDRLLDRERELRRVEAAEQDLGAHLEHLLHGAVRQVLRLLDHCAPVLLVHQLRRPPLHRLRLLPPPPHRRRVLLEQGHERVQLPFLVQERERPVVVQQVLEVRRELVQLDIVLAQRVPDVAAQLQALGVRLVHGVVQLLQEVQPVHRPAFGRRAHPQLVRPR
eukprot:15752-Rhodomonas_salina.2